MSEKARVMIVDDHPIVRYGVSRMLNNEPDMIACSEVEDAQTALDKLEKEKVDVVVLDISLKSVDGLNLTRMIKARHPNLPVLILSMHDEKIYARKALRSGASGYIMKEESSEKLVGAIRHVLSGKVYVSDEVKSSVIHEFAGGAPSTEPPLIETLSDRERQVFILIGQGYPTRVIAERLHISAKTIETHRARIKVKLGIDSTSRLMLSAAEWVEREGLSPSVV